MEEKKKRRPDRKVREAIKKRDQEMREAAQKAHREKYPEKAAENKVSYDQWWMMVSAKVSLRYSMKEVIFADMKARGLTKCETEKAYDDALRTFGINW